MSQKKTENLFWHDHEVSSEDRGALKGHEAVVLWFTGLSASGKSTVANIVDKKLNSRGTHTYLLDGDNIRQGLNSNLGFSPEDRTENIRRIGEVSKLLVDAGLLTITAFISPFREDREMVRNLFPTGKFIEIFCNASLATCEERDVKGLYQKAKDGEIPEFTGISSPYEEPTNAELILDSNKQSPEALGDEVIQLLEGRGLIKHPTSFG